MGCPVLEGGDVMYRHAEKDLRSWLDHGKGALLVYGARQVGKTWLIREMLRRSGRSYL